MFLSELSPALHRLLSPYRVELQNQRLIVHFFSHADRQIAAHSLHTAVQQEIGLTTHLLSQVNTLELECWDTWKYRISPEMAIEVMPLPVLSFEEIVTELDNNWQIVDGSRVKMPAILVAMHSGMTVMASPDIHRVCGVRREELLQLHSAQPFFSEDEHLRYDEILLGSREKNTIVRFKSAILSARLSAQRSEHEIEMQLIRTEWREVCRLMRFLQLPRAIC